MMKHLQSEDSGDDFTDCGKDEMHGRSTDRKKRRGVIEKRRRDRINGSLSELKRLVPSAYEKQGSTKLEKAEILQMTVDHLRLLNAKGLNGYGVDPSSLALDYRSVGFRECVAEVARYLAAVEGMDLQDPLRMRLLGHLEAYSAQRDVTAKANLQSFNSWGTWSRFHSSNTSLGHAKYSYGLTGKSALNQLGLFSSNNQNSEVDNAYLAASRLGSAIGLSNHTSPPTMTSSNIGHMSQTVPQQTASCHFAMTHSLSPRDNNASSHFNNLSGSHHGHGSMKLVRGFGTDLAY